MVPLHTTLRNDFFKSSLKAFYIVDSSAGMIKYLSDPVLGDDLPWPFSSLFQFAFPFKIQSTLDI